MFAGLANFITKHSKLLIAAWIVILLCTLPWGLQADDKLEYDLTKMTGTDSESGQGNQILSEYFDNSISMEEILVVCYDDADGSTKTLDAATAMVTTISEKLTEKYSGKVTTQTVGHYSKEGNTTGVLLVSMSSSDSDFSILNETGNIRSIVKDVNTLGFSTYVTGNGALTYDTMDSANGDVAKVDPISILLILILLGLFFYAVVTAVLPPIGVGIAYAIALFVMYLVGSMTGVYYLTKTLVLVTMLGAGCDYGIFIITRYREEAKKGADHTTALKTAIEWAGESVFTSGLSVIIGFGCLAICDFSMVRSMGVVLALGIVLALLAALTFVPAIVNLIGEKVFWPSKIQRYKDVDSGNGKGFYAALCRTFKRYFAWVSRVTRRFAAPIVIVAVIVCVPTVYVYATSNSSYNMIAVEPNSESKDGLYAIMDETYGGTLMPTYVVMELNENAVAKLGTITLGTTSVPYVVWSSAGLTIDAATQVPSGEVVTIMQLSNAIATKHSNIVAAASSVNSWYTLYMQAYQSAATTVKAAVIEQCKTAGITDETVIEAQVQSAIAAKVTPAAINTGIYTELGKISTTVQAAVGQILTLYSGGTTWTATPTATSSLIPGLTMMNIMDGIINVSTGLINVDNNDASKTGMYANMMVITNEKPMSDNTMALVDSLHDELKDNASIVSTFNVDCSGAFSKSYVTGQSAVMDDISSTVTSQFNVIQIVVIILLIILLFFILGCYLTPIRALINIMMSVIWTMAVTHIVFEQILNTPLCWIVPIVLFVVLLGLGMDYDIFLTTRIREYKVRGYGNHEAIEEAIKSASSTISLCALIMGGTFLSLLVANSAMLQEFGFALGFGILLDGLVMVTFVAPALMHLMGDWSWKGPKFLQRKHKDVKADETKNE